MCLSLQPTPILENELSVALKLYFSQVNFHRNCNLLAELFRHELFYYCSNLIAECSRVVTRRAFLQQGHAVLVHSTNLDLFYTHAATLLAHKKNQNRAPNCGKLLAYAAFSTVGRLTLDV